MIVSAPIARLRQELFDTRLSNIELWNRVGELKDRLEDVRMQLASVADALASFRCEDEDLLPAIRRLFVEHRDLHWAVQIAIDCPEREVRVSDVERGAAVIVCSEAAYEDMRGRAAKYDRLVEKCLEGIRANHPEVSYQAAIGNASTTAAHP